jgi:hypothetical protein
MRLAQLCRSLWSRRRGGREHHRRRLCLPRCVDLQRAGVTDSAANTYSLATNAITYGHGRSYIYFAHVKNALASGNKITITTSSVSNRVAVASVFSGLLDTNLLDKTLANPTGTSTTTNGNNPTCGTDRHDRSSQ